MEVSEQTTLSETPTPPKTGKTVTFSDPVHARRTGVRRREITSFLGEPTAETRSATPPMVRPSILKPSSPLIKPSHADVSTHSVTKRESEDSGTTTWKPEKARLEFQAKSKCIQKGDIQQYSVSQITMENKPKLKNEKELIGSRALPSSDNKTKMVAHLPENPKTPFSKGTSPGNSSSSKIETGKDKPQQSVSPVRQGVELSFLRELKNRHKFSVAFDQQNQVAKTAIKSLDSLNDQIVQYIFGPAADAHGHSPANTSQPLPPPLPLLLQHHHPPPPLSADPTAQGEEVGAGSGPGHGALSAKEQESVQASMVLIRRLLHDAQSKFRKMVEENKQLAVRIDSSLQSANQEVHALRAELADTNKRLSQISTSSDGGEMPPDGEGEEKDKGGGGGGGGGVSVGVGVRAGLKETDIDAYCGGGGGGDSNNSSSSRTELVSVGGGGDSVDGGEGGGEGKSGGDRRTKVVGVGEEEEGEEKMDSNKEEMTSEKGESEAGGDGEAEGDVSGGKDGKAADDSLNTTPDSSFNLSLTSPTPNNLSSISSSGGGDNHTNSSNSSSNNQYHLIQKLREENARLESQVRFLSQEVTSLRGGGGGAGGEGVGASEGAQPSPGPPPHQPPPSCSGPSYGELKLELIQARQELNRAKEALQAMKSDRKRLKTEKVELLHQMKQLYVTLDDKESELRDFIRNYEQRVQESDESIKQLAMEKDESERDKWEIIKKARESAERAVVLRTQLDSRDITVKELQEEVAKLKEQLTERGLDESRESDNATPTPTAQDNGHVEESGTLSPSTPACLLRSPLQDTLTSSGLLNHHPTTTLPSNTTSTTTAGLAKTSTPVCGSAGSIPSVGGGGSGGGGVGGGGGSSVVAESGGSETGSCHTPEGYLSKDDSCSGGTPMSTPSLSDRGANESLSSLMKWMTLSSEGVEGEGKNAKKKKKSFGSLSRVFGRNRSRRSIALPHSENLLEDGSGTKLSLLTPDNYQEKLQTVEGVSGVHMAQWRAGQVLAWLETSLGMPMYGRNCALNIKSGKILLGLSDSELGTALGITNHIHKRKLRLAIEEHRDPTSIKFPQASKLDVTWVSHKLLPDLGLPQYSHVFERNLVDGRLLHSLSRRDLEKHFDIHRKFHQASILHAVELLRRMEFDREKLAERRSQCEDSDSDLIVWNCSRLVAWIQSIDLGEFAEHLHESGVHGAMMVLEPSFNADTLATALAIPPSKAYIRRHLSTELDTLLRPARAALDTPNNNSKHLDPGGKGYTFTRSYRGHSGEDGTKGRLSFRGSLGRAFGKKIRDDLKLAFDSDSPKWKISAPIPIQHTPSPLLQTHKPHPAPDKVVEIPGDSTAV